MGDNFLRGYYQVYDMDNLAIGLADSDYIVKNLYTFNDSSVYQPAYDDADFDYDADDWFNPKKKKESVLSDENALIIIIVAIVVGALLVLITVATVIYIKCCKKRIRRNKRIRQHQEYNQQPPSLPDI